MDERANMSRRTFLSVDVLPLIINHHDGKIDGTGKSSLVYHLQWPGTGRGVNLVLWSVGMLSDRGPQARFSLDVLSDQNNMERTSGVLT